MSTKCNSSRKAWSHKLILGFQDVASWVCRLRILNETETAVTVLCLHETIDGIRGNLEHDWGKQIAAARQMERLSRKQTCDIFQKKKSFLYAAEG
jgi:hypothetical protein